MKKLDNVHLIAVCGGIASGKSLAIDALKSCGASVLSCDSVNRQLLLEPEYIALIAQHFPDVVKEFEVDKAALREIILTDERQKKLLNSIAHPLIFNRIISQANELGGVVFVEVPLLSVVVKDDIFNKIWFIKAAHELRLCRLMQRDNMSKDDAEKFIALQVKENDVELFADRIIVNNGTYNQLCKTIKDIYQQELLQ